MTPRDEQLERLTDEDTPAGVRIRLRALEKAVVDLEKKVDRLTWALVLSALSLSLSILAATYG